MSHDNVLSRMSNKKSCITLHTALKASSDSVVRGDTPTIGCGFVTDCDFQQLSNLSLHSSATFLAFLTCFSLAHLLNRICLGSLTAAQTSLFCPTSRRNQEKELSQTCNFHDNGQQLQPLRFPLLGYQQNHSYYQQLHLFYLLPSLK